MILKNDLDHARGSVPVDDGEYWDSIPPGADGLVLTTDSNEPLGVKWATVAGASGGTVTTVSVASANGFAGTVANATTTPALTLKTSITGILKGNGTTGAVSAAEVAATSLLGNPTGSAAAPSEITLAGGLTFVDATLSVGALTPTSVAASGGIAANGATPPTQAANPGTASGTDATVINAIVTILTDLGFCLGGA